VTAARVLDALRAVAARARALRARPVPAHKQRA
jgi:hypothetical protein